MEWISVNDRLPEPRSDVLICFVEGTMTVGFRTEIQDEDVWNAITDVEWYSECENRPTHWMPLPPAPKEDAWKD